MSRIMQMPPPPPLLLTRRVTSFLRANLSSHIHSAMLTTPAGSLLAHASNLPATALRRQAAVAASLWALQSSSSAALDPADPALPPGSTVRARRSGRHASPTVTVQLDTGAVFVIRRLRCGMLFICMGGTEAPSQDTRLAPAAAAHLARPNRSPALGPSPVLASDATADTNHTALPATADPVAPPSPFTTTTNTTSRPSTPPHPQIPTITTPPAAPSPTAAGQATAGPGTGTTTTTTTTPGPQHQSHHQQTPPPQNSPSQASILSNHTARTTGAASTTSTATLSSSGGGVSLMRRQVEELARWLDEKLGGLCVPEEGIGIGMGMGMGMGSQSQNGSGNGGYGVGSSLAAT